MKRDRTRYIVWGAVASVAANVVKVMEGQQLLLVPSLIGAVIGGAFFGWLFYLILERFWPLRP